MNESQGQITQKPPGSSAGAPGLPAPAAMPSVQRKPGVGRTLLKYLHAFASLRLTVVLFALSIFLVFCGTLAQVDAGIWTVVSKYFRSLYVWIPLQIFFSRKVDVGGGFPYPGGWLLGILLLVNLLAAHAVRFKLSWKRSGIIILHAGLIIMMVSELITGLYAVEGSMLIHEGKSANFVYHPHETELAIIAAGPGDTADVTVVPMAMLKQKDAKIQSDVLPFDVEVVDYMVNSRVCKLHAPTEYQPYDYSSWPDAPSNAKNPATAGIGVKDYVCVKQKEASGVENKEDLPAAYFRFREKGTGKDLGTYMLALLLEEETQTVKVGDKQYDVRLRHKRSYKPYTIHLIKFTHDVYPGTEKPKNFASQIRLVDPTKSEDREVKIYMNNPLFYGGETFYQQSFLQGDTGTILQVVHNPGWSMPYVSFTLVALGMLIHFGMHLVTFLSRRMAL